MARSLAVGRPAIVRQVRVAEFPNSPGSDGSLCQQQFDRQWASGAASSSPATTPASTPFPTRPSIARRFSISARGTALSDKLTFSGNVYYRYILTNTLNGDINDDSLDQSIYQPSAAEARSIDRGWLHRDSRPAARLPRTRPFPFWRCIAQVLQRDEPGEKCNGSAQSHADQLSTTTACPDK